MTNQLEPNLTNNPAIAHEPVTIHRPGERVSEQVKPRLEIRDVVKTYPGVRALNGASFFLKYDETIGFVGENGAGKSTMFDMLTGLQQPDSGEVLLNGQPVQMNGMHDAMQRGVFRVFQEQALIGELTVYENLCLGMEERFVKYGVLEQKRMREHGASALKDLGIDMNINEKVRRISFARRQLIEIARVVAMSRLLKIDHPVVLLDEPTASLSGKELQIFFKIVRKLRADFEASVIFISHRLEEVLELSDRIYVLKDGQVVADTDPDVDERELHRLMVGREQSADFYGQLLQREEDDLGEPVLAVEKLSARGVKDVSLVIRGGEIVGIGGLVQSGKTDVGQAVFGAVPCAGTIRVGGVEIRGEGPQSRIQAGIGYIPLHRHAEGILLGKSILENMTLAALPQLSPRGILQPGREKEVAERYFKDLRVKAPSIHQYMRNLSGGNQQKVVIGKWLACGLKVLIADNPTRGVDAGAKEEIYRVLRDLAASGMAILLISDDLLELIGLSNRILFMREGEISGDVPAPPQAKPAEHDVIELMV